MRPNFAPFGSTVRRSAGRATLALVAGVGVLAGAAGSHPAGAVPAPLTWAAPALVDTASPYPIGNYLSGVSCPSTSLCVAVDQDGNVVTSTGPGASTWTIVPIDGDNLLQTVSCPSTTLCVAVDDDGNVVTSTDPAGGAGAWTVTDVDGTHDQSGISCPTTTLCVDVDYSGNVITSTNPLGGSGAWSATNINGTTGMSSVSCPTATFCATAGFNGNVQTAVSPAGGPWTSTTIDSGDSFDAISCASAALCVTLDSAGNAFNATDPTGGSSKWTKADIDGTSFLSAIDCPTTALCLAADASGDVVTTTTPTGAAGSWHPADVDGTTFIAGIACPTATSCVAVDAAGNRLFSTNPTGGTGAWRPTRVDGANDVQEIDCPSTSLCVGGDLTGDVVTTTNPTGGTDAWTLTNVDAGEVFEGVACPTTTFCVAVDSSGNILTATNPTGGVGAWTSAHVGNAFLALACPTTTLCVAVDDAGHVVTSTDPAGGASKWTAADVDGSNEVIGVSCASAGLCVAIDDKGNVVTSTNPTGGASQWTVTGVVGPHFLSAISCPTTSLCVATDNAGNVLTSTTPTGGAATWVKAAVDDTYVASVSCPTATFCTAVDDSGNALTSTNPTGGVDAWSAASVDDTSPNQVSCPTSYLCVATDHRGRVVVGTGTPPVPTVTSVSPASGSTTGGTAVTVSGTNLDGATAVDFGTASATITSCNATTCQVTDPAGSAGAVAVTVTTPGGTTSGTLSAANTFTYVLPATAQPYHPLTPARICDTRSGGTRVGCETGATLGAGGVLTVTAAGQGGVPATGATAVVVNVTVADTTAQSHLTVFPGGQSQPTASNLNWVAGETVPNLVTVGLSATGTFEAENFAGSTDVIVDVEGYYGPSAGPGAGLYNALTTPARICDTRPGDPSGLTGPTLEQCEGLAPTPGDSLAVGVEGFGGVPASGVGAVILNVTAIGATSSGHLTAYPNGSAAPLASNVNFTAGDVVPNRVMVPVGTGGKVDILSSAGNPAILVDVAGWFTDTSNADASGALFVPATTPLRICDTRTGLSYTTACTGLAPGAGQSLPVVVAGTDSIPTDATAVVTNVTVTGTTARSHLTVYPNGQSQPTVSDLNWATGQTVPNLSVVTVGTDHTILAANFAGSTNVIIDVVGWYVPTT